MVERTRSIRRRAAGGAVHHARQQRPEPGMSPSGVIMRVARKMDVPVTVRPFLHGLVRVVMPMNVDSAPDRSAEASER